MKSITLKQAFNRLKESAAVIVDNDTLVYPSLADIENTSENQFLYISWEEEGKKHSIKFMEENNQTVKVTDDGAIMLLEDTEGDRVQLTLLQPATYETYEEIEEDRMIIEQALKMLEN
jgi:hypothetical protein